MKDNIVLVDMKNMPDDNENYKDICDKVIVKHNAIGIMLSSIPKEELTARLQKGLCDIKLENNKYLFDDTDDNRYKVYIPDRYIKVTADIKKNILDYYLDGYETLKLEDCSEKNCIVSGESNEVRKLMYALGRNCIRVY